MRGVLEQIVAHPQSVDPAVLAEIQRYTKLFWINTGPYNNLTARKFILTCTPEQFAAAAHAASAQGATFPLRRGESLSSGSTPAAHVGSFGTCITTLPRAVSATRRKGTAELS